jgi:hypothetical protein
VERFAHAVSTEGLALAHGCDAVSHSCACVSCAYWSARGDRQHSIAVPPACDESPRRQLGWGCANRYTPLHLAPLNGTTAVVELLLAHGADVNSLAKDGCGAHTQWKGSACDAADAAELRLRRCRGSRMLVVCACVRVRVRVCVRACVCE